MLYHASPVGGLKTLLPHRSTHEEEYVYALRDPLTPLFFGARMDDFDLLIDLVEGRPVLTECYPNAFQKVFRGVSCSLYTVKSEGFWRIRPAGRPSWSAHAR